MSRIEIRDAKYGDIQQLVLTFREKDRIEVNKLGYSPRQALLWSYRNSFIRRTGLVDGRVAAMWGVAGQLTSIVGTPWFLTGTEFEKASPLKMVKLYKREVQDLLQLFPGLENRVDSEYPEAIKLLELVGFTVEDKTDKDGFKKFYIRSEVS